MAEAVGSDVEWLPGATPVEALRSLATLGRRDVCHAHMTLSEAVAAIARPLHRAPIVSTRHFAARRGSRSGARMLAPLLHRSVTREIAVSQFVAGAIERPPHAVVVSGVPASPVLWVPSNRSVLVLQRLEPEKDTPTALRAWQASGLSSDGWSLRIVGYGSCRSELEQWVTDQGIQGVAFKGWTSDVPGELAHAGVLLAPAPVDSFGALGVLEAMAAGVPVVACASGGHLETVGRLAGARLFRGRRRRGSGGGAAIVSAGCRAGGGVGRRTQLVARTSRSSATSTALDRVRDRQQRTRRAEPIRAQRAPARAGLRSSSSARSSRGTTCGGGTSSSPTLSCAGTRDLRVLFVEPPADPLHDLWRMRRPRLPRVCRSSATRDGFAPSGR